MISVAMTKKRRDFDPRTFLVTIVEGSRFVLLPKYQTIFFVRRKPLTLWRTRKFCPLAARGCQACGQTTLRRSDKGSHEPRTGVD